MEKQKLLRFLVVFLLVICLHIDINNSGKCFRYYSNWQYINDIIGSNICEIWKEFGESSHAVSVLLTEIDIIRSQSICAALANVQRVVV